MTASCWASDRLPGSWSEPISPAVQEMCAKLFFIQLEVRLVETACAVPVAHQASPDLPSIVEGLSLDCFKGSWLSHGFNAA